MRAAAPARARLRAGYRVLALALGVQCEFVWRGASLAYLCCARLRLTAAPGTRLRFTSGARDSGASRERARQVCVSPKRSAFRVGCDEKRPRDRRRRGDRTSPRLNRRNRPAMHRWLSLLLAAPACALQIGAPAAVHVAARAPAPAMYGKVRDSRRLTPFSQCFGCGRLEADALLMVPDRVAFCSSRTRRSCPEVR